MAKTSIEIEGVWIRATMRGSVELLVEVKGEWRLLVEEVFDGAFSHIVEPEGIKQAPRDRVTQAAAAARK